MKASDLIKELQERIEIYGDLEVVIRMKMMIWIYSLSTEMKMQNGL